MNQSIKVRILFVCLGNICRSPTAHAIFSGLVKAEGLQERILVNSAGTGGWHVGNPPDPRSIAAAQQRGVDLSHLRASQVQREDFEVYDYILAMDRQNLQDLQALAPSGYQGQLDLLLNFDTAVSTDEVPDPYYGGQQGFIRVVELIESASQGLLQAIRSQHRL